MAKLLNMLITLPVILVPVAILSVKPAGAEMVSPTEALEILAKSDAASSKCGVLMGQERAELKQYVARAEIAAARRMGPEEANGVVLSGRAAGKSVSCTGETTAEIYVRWAPRGLPWPRPMAAAGRAYRFSRKAAPSGF
ncbi:MAG: hypothetical protein U1E67_15540 [Hyphomicrobiales bacterium]